MTPPLLKIIRLLPELSDAELDDLLARIRALRQFGSATPTDRPVESDEQFVLGCISELLVSLGAPATMPLLQRAVSEKISDGSSFREKVPGLMQFLHRAHKQRVGRRALLMIGLRELREHLSNEGMMSSYKTLMANIHRVPWVLDACFPTYLTNGTLPWALGEYKKSYGSQEMLENEKAATAALEMPGVAARRPRPGNSAMKSK